MEQERTKGALAVDAPAKLIDVQTDRRSDVAEALFQRRKRSKRAIVSMREGSLTPVEQVAELGSEQGAQDVLRAATFFFGGKTGSSKAASDECDAGAPGVGGRHKVRKEQRAMLGRCPGKADLSVQNRRSAAVAEAMFHHRKRFKRAINNMREGSLTSAEQVAELGSEQGAQEVLRAAIFGPSRGLVSALERTQGRHLRAGK